MDNEINYKHNRYDKLVATIDLLDGTMLIYEAERCIGFKHGKSGDVRLSRIGRYGNVHFEGTQSIEVNPSSEKIIKHLNNRYLCLIDRIHV